MLVGQIKCPERPMALIGQGTYGEVHATADGYAVKITGIENGLSCVNVSELMVMVKLDHPNIIKPLDIRFEGYQQLVQMELFASDLTQFIGQQCPMGLSNLSPTSPWYSKLKPIFQQMVAALVCLDHYAIIHRDIKLANFLLKGDRIVLIDFGLSVCRDRTTKHDYHAYTSGHRAPEVLADVNYTNKADVWALAHSVYQLATGALLFNVRPQAPDAALHQILKITGRPIDGCCLEYNNLNPKITNIPIWSPEIKLKLDDASLNDLLIRMLHPDPAVRLSIYQIQAHPYFNKDDGSPIPRPIVEDDPVQASPSFIQDDPIVETDLMEKYHRLWLPVPKPSMDELLIRKYKVATNWMLDVLHLYECSGQIYFMALHLFNRIFWSGNFANSEIQLYAISCVAIAEAMYLYGTYRPYDDYNYTTVNSYTVEQIMKTCQIILTQVNHQLLTLTPFEFLDPIRDRRASNLLLFCLPIPKLLRDPNLYQRCLAQDPELWPILRHWYSAKFPSSISEYSEIQREMVAY